VGRLSAIFFDARPDPASSSAEQDAIEPLLSDLCARARAAYPGFAIADDVFVGHLARCGAVIQEGGALHAEDLYLACACLQGEERALALLVEVHRPVLAASLRRIDASSAFGDDIEQRFWDSALVGTLSAAPRLSLYSGRGALSAWVAVAAQRIALMSRRHEEAEGRARRLAEETDAVSQDAELAFIKERYRDCFKEATQQALDTLDDRERMIFRLHVIDGVTIERIAKGYGVSHSTVSRWFANARTKVIDELRRVLTEQLKVSPAELESLKNLVMSQLDLSASRTFGIQP
jgi:RNA polymerase sigma-70 factor (ECF subfamily)